MDDNSFSFITLLIVGFVALVVIIAFSTNSAENKGKVGEFNVVSIILKSIKKGLYGYVLHNLYIPKADGGTSEIDVVLVCTKGIFVFESKNYIGWIFGDDEHKYWTVTLYGGKDLLGFKKTEKHKFYNPIWQNNTHIRNLKLLLGNAVPMNSIIIFSDECELKNVVNNSGALIMHTNELRNYLSIVRNTYEDVLSIDEVNNIHSQLLSYIDIDGEKKKKHLTYVIDQQTNPLRCPYCGGNLVVRTAKKGANIGKQFYGCSNFPKCKYTRNIE